MLQLGDDRFETGERRRRKSLVLEVLEVVEVLEGAADRRSARACTSPSVRAAENGSPIAKSRDRESVLPSASRATA